MMIHFRYRFGLNSLSACGAEFCRTWGNIRTTHIRKKVTCKLCKKTKEFRKIK
jgi:hypothetical protein